MTFQAAAKLTVAFGDRSSLVLPGKSLRRTEMPRSSSWGTALETIPGTPVDAMDSPSTAPLSASFVVDAGQALPTLLSHVGRSAPLGFGFLPKFTAVTLDAAKAASARPGESTARGCAVLAYGPRGSPKHSRSRAASAAVALSTDGRLCDVEVAASQNSPAVERLAPFDRGSPSCPMGLVVRQGRVCNILIGHSCIRRKLPCAGTHRRLHAHHSYIQSFFSSAVSAYGHRDSPQVRQDLAEVDVVPNVSEQLPWESHEDCKQRSRAVTLARARLEGRPLKVGVMEEKFAGLAEPFDPCLPAKKRLAYANEFAPLATLQLDPSVPAKKHVPSFFLQESPHLTGQFTEKIDRGCALSRRA